MRTAARKISIAPAWIGVLRTFPPCRLIPSPFCLLGTLFWIMRLKPESKIPVNKAVREFPKLRGTFMDTDHRIPYMRTPKKDPYTDRNSRMV